ncbi:MAG: hypothetical protein QGH73_15910 [Rhodospirillales bacterium]|jgi:hypothetical protein|nr:hypothetical protein [Rhodospirillaceae bacterium]MDP6644656.1 hypothetical protein [Rhodospirillales bacterium]MDP6843156.1 hypothetical protein [Rhodospirillales bacterium]|tara:strand:+ start:214 stop:567 length:354 start_codon:yes stop_codon:yes gene_type:complete
MVIGSDEYMVTDLLNRREKAAVLWAEHVTLNTARDRDDIFGQVRQEFTEDEVVELTMICGLFNFFNRFMDSLKIPLEPQDEVNKIKKSVQLDAGKLHDYLAAMLAEWPAEFPEPAPD